MLKKSTLLSVSIFFLLFISLSDYGYAGHKSTHKPGGGGGGDGGGNVPVTVTFRDNLSADRIQGDGGVYIDREEKV
ncbi:MAG: hypothetical protein O6826_07305, partial [Acidobacteria bacterium]|nr:hypothetical protein [Acidobacteriota bacterium]